MKFLYFLMVVLGALVPFRHALHMFQQNRYELARYSQWIEVNIEGGARRAAIPTAVILAVAFACVHLDTGMILILCTVLAGVLSVWELLREKKQVYIKPLVVTNRVMRQILVLAILYASIQLVLLWAYRRLNLWLMLGMCYFGPWILIYPMGWITEPVENAIKRWYVKKTKEILDSYTGLVKIGITGSYGKTSTKNVMQTVLSQQFNSLMTPASYNTPMGITRTIREYLKPIHEVFVCEMGADHVGDITELMRYVEPSIGVVTSIGPQHLQTFKTQENIIHEKMQMIELLPKDGLGILNYDNEFIRNYKINNPVKVVTCAVRWPQADYRAENISFSSSGSSFDIVHGDERAHMETKLLGELNILNILFATAAARYLGVSWAKIQRGVREMKQVEHRLEQKEINGLHFIDDAFNANPTGAAMALSVLSMMPGKRWIVTPGMIELSSRQEELNRAFGAEMKDRVDEVILVGRKQTEPINEGLKLSGFDLAHVRTVDTEKEAFQILWHDAKPQDTILLENDLPDAFNQ